MVVEYRHSQEALRNNAATVLFLIGHRGVCLLQYERTGLSFSLIKPWSAIAAVL
jgi:hypothetical protein